jgi:hypothetical protein
MSWPNRPWLKWNLSLINKQIICDLSCMKFNDDFGGHLQIITKERPGRICTLKQCFSIFHHLRILVKYRSHSSFEGPLKNHLLYEALLDCSLCPSLSHLSCTPLYSEQISLRLFALVWWGGGGSLEVAVLAPGPSTRPGRVSM